MSRAPAPSRRVLLMVGRVEAGRLARSPLVLAGLVIAAALIWWNSRGQFPLWWVADLSIGSSMLAAAGGTLISAQLAASRVRRDGMTDLYASYPASAALRSGAHLLGAAGPLALAAVVAGAAVAWLDGRGAAGSPDAAVLAGSLLLVVLAGVLGAALGAWLPHPMAGILAVFVLGAIELDLVLTFDGWIQLTGGTGWLFPWYQPGYVPSELPGLRLPFPTAAHAAELAALAGLAAVAALWRALPRRGVTAALAAAVAVACLAVTGWAAWSQTRPIRTTELTALVDQATHPARFQACRSLGGVRYCYYPAFRSAVGQWAVPVAGVLARLPARPGRPLVVRQVVDGFQLGQAPPFGLSGWGAAADTARLAARQQRFMNAEYADPRLVPGSSVPPVYVDLYWGQGKMLGQSQLGLAITTAYWATGLPTTSRSAWIRSAQGSGLEAVNCVPAGQAREAIALWLAGSATPATRDAFPTLAAGQSPVKVGGHWLAAYNLTGSGPALLPPASAQGVALARAMLRLPARRVEAALAARWSRWLRPVATDAQLAAALGIPAPAFPPPPRDRAAFDTGAPRPECS
jgi:hypothetical protein